MKHFKTLTLLKATSRLIIKKKKKKADHTKFYPSPQINKRPGQTQSHQNEISPHLLLYQNPHPDLTFSFSSSHPQTQTCTTHRKLGYAQIPSVEPLFYGVV